MRNRNLILSLLALVLTALGVVTAIEADGLSPLPAPHRFDHSKIQQPPVAESASPTF